MDDVAKEVNVIDGQAKCFTLAHPEARAQHNRDLVAILERCVDRGLFLAPGPSFGPYPTHVRLCFTAAPPDAVERGVEALAPLVGR